VSLTPIVSRLLSASAALASYSILPGDLELIGLVCHMPVYYLHPATIQDCVFAWQWISVTAPAHQVTNLLLKAVAKHFQVVDIIISRHVLTKVQVTLWLLKGFVRSKVVKITTVRPVAMVFLANLS
jgi:hypothetical protein